MKRNVLEPGQKTLVGFGFVKEKKTVNRSESCEVGGESYEELEAQIENYYVYMLSKVPSVEADLSVVKYRHGETQLMLE